METNSQRVWIISSDRLWAGAAARATGGAAGAPSSPSSRDGAFSPLAGVVLLDAAVFRREGDSSITRWRASPFDCRVILCGRASEGEVLRAIAAGAAGYVERGDSLADLQRVIQSVGQGGAQCSAGAAQAVLKNIRRLAGASTAPQPQPLTAQEQEVFGLLAQRLRNKEIARRLGLTLPAVKSHVHRVLKKLHVGSRRDAARSAAPPCSSN